MARLLLVDDDIAEISAVKRVLARSGLAPLLATNAVDARFAVAQKRPDLLIVGAGCDGGEALAFALALDGAEKTRDIPLVLLGAADGLPERAVQLPRPIDPGALADAVGGLLAKKQPAPPVQASPPAPKPPPVPIRRAAAPALDPTPQAARRPAPAPPPPAEPKAAPADGA
ncbi:MAG TPA: molecular chaperone DnaJ, partial [Anaeromyxobacteraceae bacterium]|nr:molecular chaperone DnaJ [Anaeromyxobacteraceae bacterium]